MLKIDQKDRIILYELDRNARQPLSAIAKKARLSREAVLYRLKGYLHDGIIRNYLAVVNMAKFGFSHHKVFVKLQNLTEKQEAEVISYLCRHPSTSWVASCDGKYSLVFGVKARTLSELNSFLKELNGRYWQYLAGQDIASIVEAHHFYRDYLVNASGTTEREIRW
ncbi:MAG: Lrp/AsnC family transcriptional regulator, partial [Candidatus Micrarchaeota archaeon]|nr:Lrp/AsnC family transcriptional regulator [Candidatus Micrarchaeota archaeon]